MTPHSSPHLATPEPAAPAPEPQDDEALMAAYQAGDPRAFRSLVQRHQRPLYRFCLRSLGKEEAATDATQEVFLRIVKHAPRWEKKAKFTTWMYTIARNYCVDEARKGRFRHTESLNEPVSREGEGGEEKIDQVVEAGPDHERLSDSARIRKVVDSTLAELPEEQREVFCMREYTGLSFKEIAEATNAGENTLKSRMRYALSALRKALETAGFHPPNTS